MDNRLLENLPPIMIVPDTPTDDSETMTVVMKSIEHNAGLVNSMENDK
jgi:hypothetical protein